MENQQKMIKDDINFLEYPNWVIDKKNVATTWKIEREHGKYEIISPCGLPKHFDKIVLYFLLHRLYRVNNLESYQLTTSRYEIAKNVFPGVKDFGRNKFDRIMLALKKWKALAISFEGLFYGDDGHVVRCFDIIDEFVLYKKTGALIIKFNETYVRQLKETTFYKFIDFEQYKRLHKTSSARLYEILVKTFKDRSEWAISLQLLAEKITFEKRDGAKDYYASDILRYLQPAINEINKKTDLYIDFVYNKDNGICIFKKLATPPKTFVAAKRIDSEQKQKKAPSLVKQIAQCMQEFHALPTNEQETILEDIARQPRLSFLPDQERIFTYMTNRKQRE